MINYRGARKRNIGFGSLGFCLIDFPVLFGWLGAFVCLSYFGGDCFLEHQDGTTVVVNPTTQTDSVISFSPSPPHPEVVIALCNSLGLYIGFPGHFPKLVQPLAFWTSGFKYCQIGFKSHVRAWWVHHCPQFKKHYRGHDIATKKVALIPHFIKGTLRYALRRRHQPSPARARA